MSELRVSVANLVKIEIDGKMLLQLNKKREEAGSKVYSMFGGSIEFKKKALPFLRKIGARLENPESKDLRIYISEGNLPEFEKWLKSEKDREITPLRELKEEFIEESGILKSLPKSSYKMKYLKTLKPKYATDRPGSEGTITQWYLYIHELKFNKKYEDIIKENLKKPGTPLLLATDEELKNNKTRSGDKIMADYLKFK